MEIELNSSIPFLDVLVNRKEMPLATKVYGKLAHTGRYININSASC
jgi:hypothetical protein